jgi:phage terminase large subunit-like protein
VDKDHVPYDQFIREGLLYTTEGNVINYGFVQKKIEELYEIYNIQAISYDRWGAELLRQRLEDSGLNMVEFGQGYKDISPASKETLRLVLEGRIAHGGNRVLRWNFDNIVVKTDEADNIKPDKKRATERIDGAVAAIMSIHTAIKRTKKKPSGGAVIINTRDNTYTVNGETKPLPSKPSK